MPKPSPCTHQGERRPVVGECDVEPVGDEVEAVPFGAVSVAAHFAAGYTPRPKRRARPIAAVTRAGDSVPGQHVSSTGRRPARSSRSATRPRREPPDHRGQIGTGDHGLDPRPTWCTGAWHQCTRSSVERHLDGVSAFREVVRSVGEIAEAATHGCTPRLHDLEQFEHVVAEQASSAGSSGCRWRPRSTRARHGRRRRSRRRRADHVIRRVRLGGVELLPPSTRDRL